MGNPIAPDIVRHLKSVSDPCLSGDGWRLVYTLSWVNPESLEPRSRIMLMELPASKTKEFTQGSRDSNPVFSADGSWVAFLRPDEKGQKQIWQIAADGGEARRLTSSQSSVVDFVCSPDGKQIVFCADVDPERQHSSADPRIPQVKVVQRIRYRYDTLGWRGDAHYHLFLLTIGDGNIIQLTDGDWDDYYPAWSPDGSRIAFLSGRRADRDFRALSEIYVISPEGGEAQLWSAGLTSVGAVAWSPDGGRLAAGGTDSPDGLSPWQSWLYVLEPDKPPRQLTDDSVKPNLGFPPLLKPAELRWTDDDRIIFLGEARGESFLCQVPASGGAMRRIVGGGCQSSALTIDKSASAAAQISSMPGSPSDLHYVNLNAGTSRPVTNHNHEYFEAHPPATLEKFCVQRDGWEIECRLWFPPDFDPSQKYPLALDIHGGPNGAFYDAFNTVQQSLATNGYLALAVNPRGSSTYGNDFMLAVLGDWGGEDYLDLMAAVDAVAQRDYVDGNRWGVHGYSYGGYMTSWVVSHTDRFKAAVVGAPCVNLHSMYGTSDIGVSFGEVQWGGLLVGAAQEPLQRSPITYASQVNTPVLLLHGEADARCPISQSEEYFVTLKRLGKEVEFVRFPGCSHQFLRLGHPKMREEYLARTLAWFNKHLKSEASSN